MEKILRLLCEAIHTYILYKTKIISQYNQLIMNIIPYYETVFSLVKALALRRNRQFSYRIKPFSHYENRARRYNQAIALTRLPP